MFNNGILSSISTVMLVTAVQSYMANPTSIVTPKNIAAASAGALAGALTSRWAPRDPEAGVCDKLGRLCIVGIAAYNAGALAGTAAALGTQYFKTESTVSGWASAIAGTVVDTNMGAFIGGCSGLVTAVGLELGKLCCARRG